MQEFFKLTIRIISQNRTNTKMSILVKPHSKKPQPSKKRCLSDLESLTPTPLFESAKPPFPILLSSIASETDHVVKIFRDRAHACQEIFTYALLVLCFESKGYRNGALHLDYIYELIEKTQFELLLPQDSQLNTHSQINIKNLLSQYLNFMSSQTIKVQTSLTKYPLILQIFVSFFRTLLYLGDACYSYDEVIPMPDVLEFLTSYFEVEVALGDRHWGFVATGIHVMEAGGSIYMAVPGGEDEMQEEGSSFGNRNEAVVYRSTISQVNKIMENGPAVHKPTQILVPKDPHKKPKKKHKKISIQNGHTELNENTKKQITINKENDRRFLKSSKILNCADIVQSRYEKESENHGSGHILRPISNLMNLPGQKLQESYFYIHHEQQQIGSPRLSNHTRNYSEASKENYVIVSELQTPEQIKTQKNICNIQAPNQKQHIKTTNKELKDLKVKMVETDQLFYRPAFVTNAPNIQFGGIRPWVNKNISQQFTSSFILEALPQPYRSNIKSKKQKARQLRKSAQQMGL